jgi:hypothetical protein
MEYLGIQFENFGVCVRHCLSNGMCFSSKVAHIRLHSLGLRK